MQSKKVFDYYSLKSMESWRGFLSIIVCIAHLFQIFLYPKIGVQGTLQTIIGILANLSVVIFFLLSGMLITFSAQNLTENKFNWKIFLVNRFTRIYPVLIFMLLLIAALAIIYPILNGNNLIEKASDVYLARNRYDISITKLIQSLFFLFPGVKNINGPVWSLFIEWWLYIFGLFVYIGYFNFSGVKRMTFYIISICVLIIPFIGYGPSSIFYFAVWLGGLFYVFYSSKNNHLRVYKLFNILPQIAFFIIVVLLFRSNKDNSFASFSNNWILYGIFQLIVALLSIKLITKVFLGKLMSQVSKFSYTLYIIHFPVFLFVFAIFKDFISLSDSNRIVLSVITFFLVLLLSYFVALFLEDKFLFRNLIYKVSRLRH